MTRLSHQHSQNRASTSVLGEVGSLPIRTDRIVRSRAVPCPTCSAAVGDPCVTANGNLCLHPSRRRMALRAEAADYDVADLRYAVHLRVAGRREVFRRSGVKLTTLARQLGMTYNTLRHWLKDMEPAGPEGARLGAWLREHADDKSGLIGDAPPVNLPPQSSVPERHRSAEHRLVIPSRLDAGSECRDCGKWLPGERSLCGRCSTRRPAGGRS